MQIGILGAGFTGKAIGRYFNQEKHIVWGTTRELETGPKQGLEKINKARGSKWTALEENGIKPVLFDGKNISNALVDALQKTSHLIISIAPPREEIREDLDKPVGERGPQFTDPTLELFQHLDMKNVFSDLQWIGYLSTVGVYGNHDGAWVNEETPPRPVSMRSRQRVRAEKEWQAFAVKHDLPLSLFRLSGIYGPGRNGLLNAEKGKARRLIKKNQVFNRIYVQDIARAVFLAAEQKSEGIFNISDDCPAPPQDVVTYAHQLLQLDPPVEMDFETAELSPMARSFYGENKRVSNQKSKQELGLAYQWPDYKKALDYMFEQQCWRG